MPAMTSTMTIDRHRYITTLRNAGMDEKLATAHAQGLADALQETVATKADLYALQNHMDAKFAAVDAKFDAMDAKFDAKFDAMDAKFDAKSAATDAKFDAKLDSLKSHLDVKLAQIDTKFAEAKADTRTLAIAVLIPLYALAIGGLWTAVQALRQPTAPAAISAPVKP